MPLYASRSLTLSVHSSPYIRWALLSVRTRSSRRLQVITRNASVTTAPTKSSTTSRTVLSERNDTQSTSERQDTLQRVRSILLSTLRLQGKVVPRTKTHSLIEPLVEACDVLSTAERRKNIVVTVYGEETPCRNLVTVLLDDPLSSDTSLRSELHQRWSAQDKTILRLQQAGTESNDLRMLSLPSPFFSRFSSPVTLQELQSSSSPPDTIVHLFEADIPIVVVSPLYSPPQYLLSALSPNPHALLVVDGAFDPSSPSADIFRTQIAKKYAIHASRVLLVDTARALRGAAALSTGPSSASASAVRTFQDDMLSSGVPGLLHALSDAVSLGLSKLRADAESSVTSRALETTKDVIHEAQEETRHVRSQISALQEEALEARERMEVEILGGDSEVAVMQKEQNRVACGIDKVKQEVRGVVNGLAWYRLPFVVDDVSVGVDRAIERAFAREFENELIFHTGRLASLQAHFVSRTTAFLNSLPPAFHSSVLQNSLAQITSSPSFAITPTSPSPSSMTLNNNQQPPPALLTPLRTRTTQLTYATRSLHLTAQRLLLFTFTNTSISALSSSLLYVHASLDAPTSISLGLLATLAGLRWSVGRWARARERWWNAFGRVGDGLERDLGSVLGSVLDESVCIVPREACEGLKGVVERRERDVGALLDEVERFEEILSGNVGDGDADGEKERDEGGRREGSQST